MASKPKVQPLERMGNGANKPQWARLNIRPDVHEKLVKLCKQENTKIFEMVRFLVDKAVAGEIDFGAE